MVYEGESIVQGIVRAPGRMDLVEALGVGTIDGLLAAAVLSHEANDTAGKVVDYALLKPTGLSLAVFSALCLKSAAVQIYKAARNS